MPQHATWFLLFSSAAVALYWLCPPSLRRGLLLTLSLGFLWRVDPRAALLLPALGVLAWALADRAGLAVLGAGLPALILLGLRAESAAQRGLVVPVGLSFAALRLIHYVVEKRRGTLPPHDLVSALGWLLFFPAVTVGPLQRFEDWARWERRARWDDASMALGFRRIVHGYAKVLLLGFVLVGQVLGARLALSPLPAPVQAGVLRCLWLWACFAGYTDIAIGLGLMLGQRLPENFDWPLLRPNLGAFWRSWHASVSDWCRQYVYQPVVSWTRSTLLASVASMLALGLWHEISVQYIAWGLYQGCGIATWQAWRRWQARPRLPLPSWLARGLATALTCSFILGGYVIGELFR